MTVADLMEILHKYPQDVEVSVLREGKNHNFSVGYRCSVGTKEDKATRILIVPNTEVHDATS